MQENYTEEQRNRFRLCVDYVFPSDICLLIYNRHFNPKQYASNYMQITPHLALR